MQNKYRNILFFILIAVFILILFYKIWPIIIKPSAKINDIKLVEGIYIISGEIKNANNIQVFDREISYDANYKFELELIPSKNNYITILTENKWGTKNKQTFYIK